MSLVNFLLSGVFFADSKLFIPREYFIFLIHDFGEPEYEKSATDHTRVGFNHLKSKWLFLLEDGRRYFDSNPGDIVAIFRVNKNTLFDFDKHEYDLLSSISKYVLDGSFIIINDSKLSEPPGNDQFWRILFREQKVFIQVRRDIKETFLQGKYPVTKIRQKYVKYEWKDLDISNLK